MAKITPKQERLFDRIPCFYCLVRFSTRDELTKHIKEVHDPHMKKEKKDGNN